MLSELFLNSVYMSWLLTQQHVAFKQHWYMVLHVAICQFVPLTAVLTHALASIYSKGGIVFSSLLVCQDSSWTIEDTVKKFRMVKNWDHVWKWDQSFKDKVTGQEYENHFWCTMWVKKNPPPLAVFWKFFANGWEFLINFFTKNYYTILSTLHYKFLFRYLEQWHSYAILSATTQRIFTFH